MSSSRPRIKKVEGKTVREEVSDSCKKVCRGCHRRHALPKLPIDNTDTLADPKSQFYTAIPGMVVNRKQLPFVDEMVAKSDDKTLVESMVPFSLLAMTMKMKNFKLCVKSELDSVIENLKELFATLCSKVILKPKEKYRYNAKETKPDVWFEDCAVAEMYKAQESNKQSNMTNEDEDKYKGDFQKKQVL